MGLPSQKSLYQILTERFLRAQLNAHELQPTTEMSNNGESQVKVPEAAQKCKLFILTNYQNHDDTVNHFRDNNFFGAHPDSFVFFPQAMLPAVDLDGKILMAS